MNIIVTGGSGLVGKALKETLSEINSNKKFIFLSSKDCDLTDYEETISIFTKFNPTMVIHLAAYVGGLFKNMNEKVNMFEKNILINLNVIRASYKVNVKKVICCLSTCIFPDKTTYPIDESMLHNGPPHSSNNAYAYAKRMLEIQCKIYNEQYGCNYICIVPTNIYGKHDNFSLNDAHVIPALIHKCYIAKRDNQKFTVYGTGSPLRQFIYSNDLAKLILIILNHYNDKSPIILSVNEIDEVSIRNVANIIAEKFDYKHMLEFDESYSDGQYKKTANNSKLKKVLEKCAENNISFSFTPLKQGLSKTIEWFIHHYNDECLRK